MRNVDIDEKTWYYSTVDAKGVSSTIHDSGISVSKKRFGLPVVKVEFHEGKEKQISSPAKINIGPHPKELKELVLTTGQVKDKDGLYMLRVEL